MVHVIIATMSYDIDLRKAVVDYVNEGNKKTEAARIFKVGRQTVYRWLGMPDLTPKIEVRVTAS